MHKITDIEILSIITKVIEDLKFKKEEELAKDLIFLRDFWMIPKMREEEEE